MSNLPVTQSVSPLRRRMLEDMAMRGLREDTQRDYIRFVKAFPAFLGRSPGTANAEDIHRFQVHQRESGAAVNDERFGFSIALLLHRNA